MGSYRNFMNNASPLAKVLMGISVISMTAVLYKVYYKPYAARRRYNIAEQMISPLYETPENTEVDNFK